MSQENELPLSEIEIQALATAKVFVRGRDLFDESILEDFTRRGEQLSASCQGSTGETYQLSVRINEQGIQRTCCTCPYDYEGLCKHLVALLLAWAHTPEEFYQVESLPSSGARHESTLLIELKGRERDELAQIIVQLTEAEPKLGNLVRRLLQDRVSSSELAKTQKALESQLRKVARGGYENDFSGVQREILFQLGSAASLERMRPHDAGAIYITVLKSLMGAGSETFFIDQEGSLMDVSQKCVFQLAELLSRVAQKLRSEWLKVLCQAYLFDFDLGVYGFAEGADAVLECMSAEEWKEVEPQLDEFLQTHPASPPKMPHLYKGWPPEVYTAFSHYGRESVLALKARLLEKFEGKAAANQFLIGYGTPEQQVDACLANEDFDGATHVARQNFIGHSGLIISFADKLNEAGQWQRAREWALQNEMTQWLAYHSALRSEPDALQFNVDLFRASPSVQQWFDTIDLAQESSRDDLKVKLWKHLQKQSAFVIQFDIHLREGDVASALHIWPKLKPWQQHERQEQLAAAAGASHVDEAFLLWSDFAEALIRQRERSAYRQAANALSLAKKLLEKEGRGAEWAEWGAALRGRYPTLRALKEELDRAKL